MRRAAKHKHQHWHQATRPVPYCTAQGPRTAPLPPYSFKAYNPSLLLFCFVCKPPPVVAFAQNFVNYFQLHCVSRPLILTFALLFVVSRCRWRLDWCHWPLLSGCCRRRSVRVGWVRNADFPSLNNRLSSFACILLTIPHVLSSAP